MRVKRRSLVAVLSVLLTSGDIATGAEPIEGRWRTPEGYIAAIARCGSSYCLTAMSEPNRGKSIGRVSGSGGNYEGTVTDPTNDRTYAGSAEVNGGKLKLTGCALKIFCRSQTWTRQ